MFEVALETQLLRTRGQTLMFVHAWSWDISMHMFCPPWSIVPSCGCRLRSLIWLCWIMLFIRSSQRLCEGKICCLGYRRKVRILCLLCNIYHRVDHPMNEYLQHLLAARNTRTSAALGDLALVSSRCRIDQFSRLLLPTAVSLWNLLPSGVFTGGTRSFFKCAMNLCLLRG